MKGRTPTAEERRWMDTAVQVGCIVCRLYGKVWTPAGIHHIDGKTKPGAHMLTIPLCSRHHQHKSNAGDWVSRHGNNRRAFEKAYAPEMHLLQETRRLAGWE